MVLLPYASYVEAEADIMSRLKTLVSDETTYDEAYAAYEEVKQACLVF